MATMTKFELRRFALRASRDLSLVPVLRDALLEHPATRDRLERYMTFAEHMTREAVDARRRLQIHVVVVRPNYLAGRLRPKRYEHGAFGGSLFSVHALPCCDRDSPAVLATALSIQESGEPIALVYATDPRRYE